LDRAVELFDELPDGAEKADAYAELGRLHMLNLELDPAVAAASVAAEIADRLGLAEAVANARITIGGARYQAGDRGGLAELQAVLELCRTQRLFALRRAIQNVAYALREEGDWAGSDALLGELDNGGTPGGVLATGYSQDAMRAHFEGDWVRLVQAGNAMAAPGGEWDLHVRCLCSWIGALGSPSISTPDDETAAILSLGRRSGFHRLHWTALAHGALCCAVQGRPDEATALLGELARSWRRVRAIASGEWIDAAAHAAAVAGRDACVTVRDMLGEVPHRTPWVEAALHAVTGGLATADGDRDRAVQMHLAAAEIYATIPNLTDRMLALAAAVRAAATPAAGLPDPGLDAVRADIAAFVARNRCPRLLEFAALAPSEAPSL
jgi:hypothetical protein